MELFLDITSYSYSYMQHTLAVIDLSYRTWAIDAKLFKTTCSTFCDLRWGWTAMKLIRIGVRRWKYALNLRRV
jgi:hypothetical protein